MHKSFKWTVLSVFTVLTSACAVGSNPETSVNSDAKTPQTARGSTQTDAEGSKPASKTFPEFSTKGKPTKTIDTPWGPKEVYDYSRDPEIIRFFETQHSSKNTDDKKRLWGSLVLKAQKTSQLDLARIGCVEIIQSNCNKIEISIDRKCEPEKNIGKTVPTSCERDNSFYNSIEIPLDTQRAFNGPALTCMRNGKLHTSITGLYQLRTKSGAKYPTLIPDYVCNKWQKKM